MKIKLRELVNPNILNDVKYVGFFGDSEYVDENGDLKMGYWVFDSVFHEYDWECGDEFKLDCMVDEEMIYNVSDMYFIIKNDNDRICRVRFIYEK